MPDVSDQDHETRTRILLVDDAADCLSALSRLFEMSGFEVATACDGRSAIGLLDTDFKPEIVFTDLMLPDIDGLKVATAARAHAVPVVVLATGAAAFDPDQIEATGVVDLVLIKPLAFRKILSELNRVLAERRGNPECGRGSTVG